jgi:hypothetical protein
MAPSFSCTFLLYLHSSKAAMEKHKGIRLVSQVLWLCSLDVNMLIFFKREKQIILLVINQMTSYYHLHE